MKKKNLFIIIYIVLALIVLGVEFLYHRATPFMMDDLWYSTNLATGEPLHGAYDVLESQVWHYLNWGGRSVTHTLLQFILMGGGLLADILNIVAAAVLAWVISLFVPFERKLFTWCLSIILMVSLNPGIQYSMFWQSGSVNYLYSTSWILFFAYIYLRELNEEKKPIKGVTFWIIPLGIITGWSNENMGPASLLLAVMVIVYLWLKKKTRPALWMFEGAVCALVGSAACILAPGNFIRSEFALAGSFVDTVKERFLSMLTAGASFLLPSVLILILLMIITMKYLRLKPEPSEIILLITGVLAYGAMILSPHFPDRACFGIMIINLVLICKLSIKVLDIYGTMEKYILYLALFGTLYDVLYICTRL